MSTTYGDVVEKADTSCPFCASRPRCFLHPSTKCNSKNSATRNLARREEHTNTDAKNNEVDGKLSQNGVIGDKQHIPRTSHSTTLIIRGKRRRKDPMIVQRNKPCSKSTMDMHVPLKSGEEVYDTSSDEGGENCKQESNKTHCEASGDKISTSPYRTKSSGDTIDLTNDIPGHEKNDESASECSRFSKTSESESDSSDNDEETHKTSTEHNGLSAYEQLRLERIQRNRLRLESLGFHVNDNSHDERKTKAKPRTKKKPISTVKIRNRYPKRSRKQTAKNKKELSLSNHFYQKQKNNDLTLFEGNHDDDCYICQDGGDLVCCDYCSKAFHMQCHIPPLSEISDGEWMCCECKATQMTRAYKCGECYYCLRPNCGKCKFCLDKPCFGGPNTKKQVCIHKNCPHKRYALPAKVTQEQKDLILKRGPRKPDDDLDND